MALEGKKNVELGPEELDPELIRLPRKRNAISPLTSLALIAFCLYALFKLWPDAHYSLESSEATPLQVSELKPSYLGKFISVKSPMDFSNPLILKKSNSSFGSRWAKLLGSNGRVWAVLAGDVWREKNPNEVLKGRLRKIIDLPQHDGLHDFLRTSKQTRILSGKELLKSKSEKTASALDVYGDDFLFKSEQEIEIRYRHKNRLLIRAPRTDEYSDEPIWRAALVEQGLLTMNDRPVQTTENEWTYELKTEQPVAKVNQLLLVAKLFAAKAESKHLVLRSLYKDIKAFQNELETGNGEVLDVESIDAIVVSEVKGLEKGAMALILADAPSTHRRSLYGFVFVVFALLFLFWNFFRELKIRLG